MWRLLLPAKLFSAAEEDPPPQVLVKDQQFWFGLVYPTGMAHDWALFVDVLASEHHGSEW